MYFEIVGEIFAVETIATGSAIRQLDDLLEEYGEGRWRKMKGRALVRLRDGRLYWAEVHWYEAHGLGRRRLKIKRLFE